MNTKLLLIAVSVAAFSSCTTLYKSGQTPDDVYFSPVRAAYGGGEERKEVQRDEVRYYNSDYRAVRLGINDRRFRYFDNDYSYSPYYYGFNYGYYYNPYFWPYPVYSIYTPIFIAPSNPKITTPRTGNLGGYNSTYNNTPTSTKTGGMRPARNYNNRNEGSAVGNVIRQVFTPVNSGSSNSNSADRINSSNNSSSNNSRTYAPTNSSSSSSSSSGSSSSSSGSGGVSRPARGGGN